MDNLPELRDIHLPTDGVSVFPLAYGWWGILAAVAILYVLIKLIIWGRRASARLYAYHLLAPLKTVHSLQSAVKMSEILRRVCVRKYPEAVAFVGQEWIDFINAKAKVKLDDKTAELLKNAPFLPDDDSRYQSEDVAALWQFCYAWIGENL